MRANATSIYSSNSARRSSRQSRSKLTTRRCVAQSRNLAAAHANAASGPFASTAPRPHRTSPSRFKHVVRAKGGKLRRLTPVELERLNGFEDGWTDGMPDGRRAFMMGNALVVGLVKRVGRELSVSRTGALQVVS